jgi:hypothetical protein
MNGEKQCNWINFDKQTGELIPLMFQKMEQNKRWFLNGEKL